MKSKTVSALCIWMCVLSVFSASYALAASPQEIEKALETARKDREALVEEQRKLQAELDLISKESASLSGAVKSLDATKKKLENDISITRSKINSSDLTIKSLENSMTEKESQIVTHRLAISTALQSLHEYNSRSLLVDMLLADQMSDVWQDRANLTHLTGQLEEEINVLRDTRSKLEQERIARERTKKELESLQGQLSGQRTVVAESQTAKQTLLNQTKSKEAEYQQMLKDNIERQRQAEADLFRLESELKIALDPSLIPSPRTGTILWPLDSVFITQRFGVTSASGRLYASGSHNGVDFRASMGTPVKAVLGGVVEGAGNTDEQRGCYSYGRWILVKHGNGLSTIYAHLSASLVKKGDTVETGQVIAYSGGTPGVNGSGYSTGPHLHLGLFASQGVSIQQFTSSRNCKSVFVPLVDAKAYLDPMLYLPKP